MSDSSDKLHLLWLEQLHREYADICFQYSLKMVPPLLELNDATHRLGCWLPGQRTIQLSRCLITDHDWGVVLMVLRHEMAHQICSEIFGQKQAGHGKNFQKACAMVGVVEPYTKASGDLQPVVASVATAEETMAGREVISKITKLLALAASDNEHEAALAMQRATEMLYRYNVDLRETDARTGYDRKTINTGMKQIPTWRRMLCGLLRDYFFVQVIFSTMYDARLCVSFKTVELLGRKANVPVASHCYHFLEQQLALHWQANRHRFKGGGKTARNSYYIGLLDGFAEKLAEQLRPSSITASPQRADSSTPGELIVCEDRQLQEFMAVHFPRLKTRKTPGVRIASSPYKEAMAQGKRIVLHRTLTEKKSDPGRWLLS